jgi:hypothetical protein
MELGLWSAKFDDESDEVEEAGYRVLPLFLRCIAHKYKKDAGSKNKL